MMVERAELKTVEPSLVGMEEPVVAEMVALIGMHISRLVMGERPQFFAALESSIADREVLILTSVLPARIV
jgi:hypothetical protein